MKTASKFRNMFYQNKKQERAEIDPLNLRYPFLLSTGARARAPVLLPPLGPELRLPGSRRIGNCDRFPATLGRERKRKSSALSPTGWTCTLRLRRDASASRPTRCHAPTTPTSGRSYDIT
ncbi:hypothetical protein AAG570_009805 [Ranatra chinensis]|uniref:Uncharacterized protein n=1 Tax=Ranatra chinensis TaxID=642074 RepID=A0ABD0ZBA1_9HEMI